MKFSYNHLRILGMNKMRAYRPPAPCAQCGSRQDVRLESSRTMYHWNGEGEDPNAPIPLCRPCAKEHHECWDGLWYEANVGRL